MKWYRIAAGKGFSIAQSNLGVMLQNGLGVPQNYPEAVKWYRLAVELDYAEAEYNLGSMYQKGLGVPQSDAEAVRLYRMAAASTTLRRKTISAACTRKAWAFRRTMFKP